MTHVFSVLKFLSHLIYAAYITVLVTKIEEGVRTTFFGVLFESLEEVEMISVDMRKEKVMKTLSVCLECYGRNGNVMVFLES